MTTIPSLINIYKKSEGYKQNYGFAVPADHIKYNETALQWASDYNRKKPEILLNQPNLFSKVKIIGYEDRKSGSVLKIQDSTGTIFDLRMTAAIDILIEKGINPGGEILTDLYIAQEKSQIIFVGKGTDLDKELNKNFETKLKGKLSSLEEGKQYEDGNKKEFIYLGYRTFYNPKEDKYQKGHIQIYYPSLINYECNYKNIEDVYNDLPETYHDFLKKYSHSISSYYVPPIKQTKTLPSAFEEVKSNFNLKEFESNLLHNYKLNYLSGIINSYKYNKLSVSSYNQWDRTFYTTKEDIIIDRNGDIFLGTKEEWNLVLEEIKKLINHLDNLYDK